MFKKTILLASLLTVACLQLQGCVVAAVAAGVAAVKAANAKKIEAKEGCLKDYNEYLKVTKHPIPLSKYCSDASYSNSDDK